MDQRKNSYFFCNQLAIIYLYLRVLCEKAKTKHGRFFNNGILKMYIRDASNCSAFPVLSNKKFQAGFYKIENLSIFLMLFFKHSKLQNDENDVRFTTFFPYLTGAKCGVDMLFTGSLSFTCCILKKTGMWLKVQK